LAYAGASGSARTHLRFKLLSTEETLTINAKVSFVA
jgi:hypothetical protein